MAPVAQPHFREALRLAAALPSLPGPRHPHCPQPLLRLHKATLCLCLCVLVVKVVVTMNVSVR